MPQVKIQLSDTVVNAIFDTGLGGLSSFSSQLLATGKLGNNCIKGHGVLELGIHDYKRGEKYLVKTNSISRESDRLNLQFIEVSDKESNLIGTGLLQGYRLVLDWSLHQIDLEETTEVMDDVLYSFGFRDRWNDGKVLVSLVWENTEAFTSDIGEGDQVISINGRDVTQISNSDYCVLKRQLQNDIDIEFTFRQRNKAVKKLSLHKKRLL